MMWIASGLTPLLDFDGGYGSITFMDETEDAVFGSRLVADSRVRDFVGIYAYLKTHCPYCQATKRALDTYSEGRNIAFSVVNVDGTSFENRLHLHSDIRSIFHIKDDNFPGIFKTVPQVFIKVDLQKVLGELGKERFADKINGEKFIELTNHYNDWIDGILGVSQNTNHMQNLTLHLDGASLQRSIDVQLQNDGPLNDLLFYVGGNTQVQRAVHSDGPFSLDRMIGELTIFFDTHTMSAVS